MSYIHYGISKELVDQAKLKMKDQATKEKVKAVLHGVTRQDLQSRDKIKTLLSCVQKDTGISIPEGQAEAIVQFVIDQRIDPNNTFHLLKLWGKFR